MNRFGRAVLVLPLLLATFAASMAGDSSSRSQDEETIWKMEQEIYSGRSGGTMAYYVSVADPDYAGWPPQMAAPMNYQQLAAQSAQSRSLSGEKLTLEKNLIRVHRDGNVAMAYYTTHRSRRGRGEAVDESFENIHVWVRAKDGWKLMGGMSRPVPPNRASLGLGLPPAPAAAPAPTPVAK
jgi:ketosteroid isomerase-like protein